MAKECGDCSLCCKLLDIPELDKPRGQWCPHVIPKRGCSIYSSRPGSCQNFVCLWLLDTRLDDVWKPNKCKMVVVAESDMHVVVYVDKGVIQPWLQEPFFSTLRKMAARGLDAGGMVTVVENEETIVILPDRGVRVGKLQSDDRIVMGEVKTSAGTRIEVSLIKADQAARYVTVGVGWTKPPKT
jgi:hypothetical protein